MYLSVYPSVSLSIYLYMYTNVFTHITPRPASGTMIPESGGMYCYLHEAFGALPAFLYMWVTTVIRNSAGAAIVALTFANYLLQPLFPDCEAVSDAATRLIAAVLICEYLRVSRPLLAFLS